MITLGMLRVDSTSDIVEVMTMTVNREFALQSAHRVTVILY